MPSSAGGRRRSSSSARSRAWCSITPRSGSRRRGVCSSPIGVGVAAGAFIFGLGMQLGGGCASGTLFSVGGGSARMLITLFFFIIGSVIGTAHMGWWTAQPALAPTSLVTTMGPWLGLALSLFVFGIIAWFTMFMEKKRHGQLVDDSKPSRGP